MIITSQSTMNHQIYLREVPHNNTSPPSIISDSVYSSDQSQLDCFNYGEGVVARHEDGDGDLEEDVLDLSLQVQELQHTIGVLAESQISTDDLYMRARQDNAGLNTRLLMLEEQTKELEEKGEEKVEDQKRRNDELIARIERMKNLEIENYAIRLQNMEKENRVLVMEVNSLRHQMERVKGEKDEVGKELAQTQALLVLEHNQVQLLQESKEREQEEWERESLAKHNLLKERTEEVRHLRAAFAEREVIEVGKYGEDISEEVMKQISEKEREIRMVRTENKKLVEHNDELQTQLLNRQVKEGRNLLAEQQENMTAEMGNMTEEQLRKALGEQKDVNLHLQTYIDNVLLNIMDRYPELLEIKNK